MARTTLDLDRALLEEAMAVTGKRTKTETIEFALQELIRAYHRRKLIEEAGTFDIMSYEELMAMRRKDKEHIEQLSRMWHSDEDPEQ